MLLKQQLLDLCCAAAVRWPVIAAIPLYVGSDSRLNWYIDIECISAESHEAVLELYRTSHDFWLVLYCVSQ